MIHTTSSELLLFQEFKRKKKPSAQLLKWVGNKFRFAEQIAATFPNFTGKYVEPFVGSGAVLATVAPRQGLAGDILKPLIEIWRLVQDDPEQLIAYYEDKWRRFIQNRELVYKETLRSYNDHPNGLDLLFLCRTCYGGVVRFTKKGKMSTPIGPHKPITPDSFRKRVYEWRERISGTIFICADYKKTMQYVECGDLVYCDPPYSSAQAILYGSQSFKLSELFTEIRRCKELGAYIALSIDGYKKSKLNTINLNIPDGIFEHELILDGGSSMLRRFQKGGQTMEGEMVGDRLLLTW